MAYRLNTKQKWQLAISLMVIYYPIFLYMYLPIFGGDWQGIKASIPFLVVDAFAILFFYFIWMGVTEWILHQLAERFGEGFLLEFKFPAQLVTVVLSLVLAVSFVMVYRRVVGLMDFGLQYFTGKHLFQQPPSYMTHALWAFVDRSSIGYFLMLMLSSFYLIANRRANQRMKEIYGKAERFEKENIQAQFSALKNQVNPHFLFNSLSILSSLVQVDAELSEKFIDQLSRAYRYILEQKDNEQVSLRTELEFIQSYVFLLKIRFEDKFNVVIQVPETYWNHYKIAPLTLQLLIENAVKHNRMSSEEPLQVYIRAENTNLIVKNKIQLRTQSDISTGVGLQNIINRYHLLTDRQVWVGESDGAFIVKIPLLS
ncbi:histidine kinase [Cytophagaceae bacterium DM2B3-1]|uniref:Histidine kinase n=1 Tax=Xanthocytophaga flava TaxID=3048013 RepID=A0ABT7CRV6_9BACT|nr:histidine kinase [Xanthocytophaga flavus]MDJ1496472.1 histidine kinase [Xanthocytophaga flavus]